MDTTLSTSTMSTEAAKPEGIERCVADPMRQPVTIILLLIYLIAAVILSYFFYLFKKEMSKHFVETESQYQRLYKLSTFFFIVIISMLFLTAIAYVFYCVNDTIRGLFAQLGMILYILQYLLLFGLLFYRLDLVFRGSPFAVSHTLKTVFYTSFVFTFILGIGMVIISGSTALIYSAVGAVIITAFFIAFVTFVISLIGAFIYKLHTLWVISHRSTDEHDLLPAMVKVFLLTFPSILSLVFVAITTVLITGAGGITSLSLFVQSVCICMDCITNFFSLYLGFTNFHSHYMRICGFCHRGCLKCNAPSLIDPDAQKVSKADRIDSTSPISANVDSSTATADKTEEAQSSDAVQSDAQIV